LEDLIQDSDSISSQELSQELARGNETKFNSRLTFGAEDKNPYSGDYNRVDRSAKNRISAPDGLGMRKAGTEGSFFGR
jgi:hypothetical protein